MELWLGTQSAAAFTQAHRPSAQKMETCLQLGPSVVLSNSTTGLLLKSTSQVFLAIEDYREPPWSLRVVRSTPSCSPGQLQVAWDWTWHQERHTSRSWKGKDTHDGGPIDLSGEHSRLTQTDAGATDQVGWHGFQTASSLWSTRLWL
jgi:hypothetical protein